MGASSFNALDKELRERDVVELMRRDYSVFVDSQAGDRFSEQDFMKANRLNYSLMLNTWLMVTDSVSGSRIVSNLLRKQLLRQGVVATIRWACAFADTLLQCSITKQAYHPSTQDNQLRELESRISRLSVRSYRQVLLYAKRFSPYVPQQYSAHHAEAIDAFFRTEEFNQRVVVPRLQRLETWLSDSRQPRPTGVNARDAFHAEVVILARRIIREIVGDFPGWVSDTPRFGNGAAANCDNTILSRYQHLVIYGGYTPSLWPKVTARALHPWNRAGADGCYSLTTTQYGSSGPVPQISILASVPKKVNARRLIAKEDPINMDRQLRLKEALDRHAARSRHSNGLPFHDQSRNRFAAKLGAYTGMYATHDASHASDSVTKQLVHMLFPQSWWEAMRTCIPYAVFPSARADHAKYISMFGTMGCGCTFHVETLVFYALGLATTQLVLRRRHNQPFSSCDLSAPITCVQAYGDDFIGLSAVADDVVSVFSYFGISTNVEKSYFSGPFRESCGADWYCPDDASTMDDVQNVTPQYWPRSPFQQSWKAIANATVTDWDGDTRSRVPQLSKLIALQRNLWYVAPTASSYLLDLLRVSYPELSLSFPNNGWLDEASDCLYADQTYLHRGLFVGDSLPDIPGLIPAKFCFNGVGTPRGYIPLHSLISWLRSPYGAMTFGADSWRCESLVRSLLASAVRYGYTGLSCVHSLSEIPKSSGVLESLALDMCLTIQGEDPSLPYVIVRNGRQSRTIPPSQWLSARPPKRSARAYLSKKMETRMVLIFN